MVITDVFFKSYLHCNFNSLTTPGSQLTQIDVDFHFFFSASVYGRPYVYCSRKLRWFGHEVKANGTMANIKGDK